MEIHQDFNLGAKERNQSLKCPSCANVHFSDSLLANDTPNAPKDDIEHVMTKCRIYEPFKANRDILVSDQDLVDFFLDVLDYRQRNNEL